MGRYAELVAFLGLPQWFAKSTFVSWIWTGARFQVLISFVEAPCEETEALREYSLVGSSLFCLVADSQRRVHQFRQFEGNEVGCQGK
jgi:hypothetical protein